MKRVTLALAAVLCLIVAAKTTPAQEWPQRPVRVVVPFGPGGGTDFVARILAESIQSKFGKPVIVENKPGAGGILGNEVVANAAPDGATLGIMTAGQIIAEVTRKTMPYDPGALTPIGQVATGSFLIATRVDFPAESVKDLVTAAKADPGKIVFANPSFGATQHFASELFQQIAGVTLLDVPFRSTPEAVNAVLSRQADVLFDTVPALMGQARAGRLKVLAVTGKDRFPAMPEVPAAAESGLLPGYDVTTWYGVFGPPGMPAPLVAVLSKAFHDIVTDEKVSAELVTIGLVVQSSSAQEFGAFMARERKRWAGVREAAGIAPQ